MKIITALLLLFTLSIFIISCGSDGKAGEDGKTVLTQLTDEKAGENCLNGGIRVDTGFDTDNDGNLAEDEILNSKYICNGENGINGEDGTSGTDGEDGKDGNDGDEGDPGEDGKDGKDGTGTITWAEEIGENDEGHSCENGGYWIYTCQNDGEDSCVEETTEKEAICNGTDGEDGKNGTDGNDGVCAGNNPPVIDSVTINDQQYNDTPIDVLLDSIVTVKVDVTDTDSDISIVITGYGTLIGQDEIDDSKFKITPGDTGIYYFSAIVSDGCETRISNFAVKVNIPTKFEKQWGTSGGDYGEAVAIDSYGNVYITGHTLGDLDGNINAGDSDIFLTKFSNEGTKLWTKQWGTAYMDISYSISIDNSDNIYVTGYTYGDLYGTNSGTTDVFLTKLSGDGNILWAKQWGTSGGDSGESVIIDSNGNIYVAGYTFGDLDGNTNAGYYDIFLTKFNSEGTKLWTKQLGTVESDYGRSAITDSNGNIYVTGYTHGNLDGNINAGEADIFIIKFDSEGTKLWTRQWGTDSIDISLSISIDSNDKIYVTGKTNGVLGDSNAGDYDVFLAKFNSEGSKLWTRQWGTDSGDFSYSVAVNNSGNIFVTGCTLGNLDGNTNAGSYDIFLTKFSSEGTKLWTEQNGTTEEDHSKAVAVDNYGTIYITGYTKENLYGTNAGLMDISLTKIVNEDF